MDMGKPQAGLIEALVQLAQRLGLESSAEAVRRRFVVGAAPPSTEALVSLASEIGLKARSL